MPYTEQTLLLGAKGSCPCGIRSVTEQRAAPESVAGRSRCNIHACGVVKDIAVVEANGRARVKRRDSRAVVGQGAEAGINDRWAFRDNRLIRHVGNGGVGDCCTAGKHVEANGRPVYSDIVELRGNSGASV